MKKNIFKQTWAIVAAILASIIGTLIVNSYTEWWETLANLTTTVWQVITETSVNAITYKTPIWTILIAMAIIALTWYLKTWYANPKSDTAPESKTPNFLTYREDWFDGVRCRWDYSQTYGGQYKIGDIICYCQHCDFIIGRPNEHLQDCPSCSQRAVRSNNRPYQMDLSGLITGYQRRNSLMPFEEFIRREIDRRLRVGAWQR